MTACPEPILVRRYAGTRLYDTARGQYVSLDMLRIWAAQSVAFIVQDAVSGKDITRIVLA